MNAEYAKELDKKDILSKYKAEFYLPKHLYYEANGLGPMSRRSEATLYRVAQTVDKVQQLLGFSTFRTVFLV